MLNIIKNKSKGKPGDGWKLAYSDFKPAEEGLREALCTLANGYFGTRGAVCESEQSRVHYPGTYIAGLYNKLATHIAGKTIYNEDLVNCPNWLLLSFKIGDGEWIKPSSSKILSYSRQLDMKRGVLTIKMRVQDDAGNKVTVESQRIVHMAYPHLAAIKYMITPENFSGTVTVRSALDATVENSGVARYSQLNSKHLEPDSAGDFSGFGIYLSVHTNQSRVNISQASTLRLFSGGEEITPEISVAVEDDKKITQEFSVDMHRRHRYRIEKTVSIYTSRDEGVRAPLKDAMEAVSSADRFDELLAAHTAAWDALWKKFNITIDGDAFTQKVLRLHMFHLFQCATVHNSFIDAGIPARGLHGEAYRGHIFWDEVFVLPFYELFAPEIAKAPLMYRYRRLEQARVYARDSGYKGAMFPWQSGATGEEETQIIHLNPINGKWGPDNSRIQRHISFDIAYNVWQYWINSTDRDFMKWYGAELMLSIAQFADSLCEFSSKDGKYHTYGLMGPDEFHEKFPGSEKAGFKDNAYTNLLIAWLFGKAEDILGIIDEHDRKRLLKKLGISAQDLERWDDISRNISVVVNEDGIVSQFDGYFKLKDIDMKAYKAKYGHIERMDRILKAEGKSPDNYNILKQADFLMLFYLFSFSQAKALLKRLGIKFDKQLLRKNYDYYERRTSHGSTLSKVVHCYVAHALDRLKDAADWYSEVLKSDIYDTQGGTTPEGIHTGVMGGSVMIALKCFAGITISHGTVKINPVIPKNWRWVKVRFFYKNKQYRVSITKQEVVVMVFGARSKQQEVKIEVYGKPYDILMGQPHKISIKESAAALVKVEEKSRRRILVVDGDITFSEVVKARLKAGGYLVETAATAQEALTMLESKWVDLIVLSVILKGAVHGYELLKDIKTRHRLSKIPVVVQSTKPAMQKAFESAGVEGYINKPYSVEQLLASIDDILK